MLSNAVAQSSSGAVANLQREQCLSMGGRRRKSSASISEQIGVLATYGTLSRSMLVYHHDQMQANAVSQRAVWVLVPRPLNYRLSDAVSAHVAPRNGGASVSAANGVHEASEALSSSFALRHHAWMQANAVSQRAVWVLVPRPLNYRLSDAYRWAPGAESPVHLFRGQVGCMDHRKHSAAALHCGITIRCRQMLCRRELRWC